MFEKQIKELLNRGSNVFVGELVNGQHVVFLKTKTSSTYGVMVTDTAASLGILQSTLLVETEEKVNVTYLRETVVTILKKLNVEVATSINIALLDAVKSFDKTIVKDLNTECVANGIYPMAEKEALEAVDLWQFDFTGTYTEVKVDNSLSTATKTAFSKYDPEKLEITPRIKGEMSLNKARMSTIFIEDNKELMNVYDLMVEGSIMGFMALGEASTGKTSAFYKMCDMAGAYGVMVNASTNMDEDFMFGSYQLNTDPDIKTKFVWKDGIFTKAYENGWWIILDESNMVQDGGVVAPMNNALEYPYKLVLNNGRVVSMHPNFRVVFAFNPGYKHTYSFNAALANRLRYKVRFPDVTLAQAKTWLSVQQGFTNGTAVEKLWDIYDYVKAVCTRDQLDHIVSYRNIEAAVVGIVRTGDVVHTIKQTMVDAIYLEERDESLASDLMDSLKKNIAELERVFTGKASTTLGVTNGFDFAPEVDLDSPDVDDILSELDNL